MAWRLASSLQTLLNEVNSRYPGRSKATDGSIGDAAHQRRPSRHNPNRSGVVTALDLTHDPGRFDAHGFADLLRREKAAGGGHPQLNYIVSNGRIASATNNWAWRVYKGSNKHDKHIHVAVGTGSDGNVTGNYDDSGTSWFGGSVGQGGAMYNRSAPIDKTDPVMVAADAAYQAGFRGQDLINMVAIVGGESNYNPRTVTKDSDDDSWGLWQINLKGALASRVTAFGLRSREDLLDPYINAQVAMKIFKQQGYGGWGAYKNGSWRKFLSRAQTAAATVEASGGSMATVGRIAGAIGASLGNQVSPYGDYGGGVDAGGFETPSDTPFDAPGGGTVYTIAETNQAWVVYPIGNAKIAFAVSPNTNVAGLSNGGTISQNQFNALNIAVNGGLTNELSLMAGQEWGTYVDQLLMQLFGRNNPARNDPEVMAVVAELAGRPDMDPTEFQNRLKATQYYQKMTLAQAQWNDLPEAERAKQRDVVSLQMVDTIFELMGVVVGPSDPLIQQYLEDVASGKTGYGAFTAAIKAKALENPESPWGRQVRGEEEMQRLRPWEIENMALKVKEQARRWGVRMAPDKATEWATNIMNKTSSEDDLNEDLKAQALIRYPTKPKDMETDIWAEQWKESYQRLLEKPADLFSPEIQQALTGEGVPLADFESKIMADPRWRGTKNGQAAIAQSLQSVGRIFGFTAGVQ